MENQYKLLITNELVPIRVYFCKTTELQIHCYNTLSVIWILSGNVQISINKKEYLLKSKDIMLINPYNPFSMNCMDSAELLIFEMKSDIFDNYYSGFSNLKFKLNSFESFCNESQDLNYVKSILAKIVQAIAKRTKDYLIKSNGLIFEFVQVLVNQYIDNELVISSTGNEQIGQRLGDISEYISHHYREKISLETIANYVHLNPQYISRYFSKNMGITLIEYITKIRLKESLKSLLGSEKSIAHIALEYGFSNLKSYFKAFKKEYGITPAKYRKLNFFQNNIVKAENFKSDTNNDYVIDNILKYLKPYTKQENMLPEVKEKYTINYNKPTIKLEKTWNKIIAFGRAAEGLRAEWRNQLRKIQKDISFEYIRFHGIFSDEMQVYKEDEQGNVEYNFSHVDELIDFFIELKLKPFIELGFIPEQLASERKYIFLWKANVSYPKSIDKWKSLVENFITHLIERYGIEQVKEWYFEIWNEFFIPFFDLYSFVS